jgi:hypothetical protein
MAKNGFKAMDSDMPLFKPADISQPRHLDVTYPHSIDTFLQLPFSDQQIENTCGATAHGCITLSDDFSPTTVQPLSTC